jgi:hypothetical protein
MLGQATPYSQLTSPKNTFALFRALAEVIAGGYIETAINT